MRFLIDADLPYALANDFQAAGHEAVHVQDVGLGTAPDELIASYARRDQRCLITGDFDFSDIRNYRPGEHHGIVVLTIPADVGRAYIHALVAQFLGQIARLEPLRGKLVIMESGRVRVRE